MARGRPASGVREFKPVACVVCSALFVPTSSRHKCCSVNCGRKFRADEQFAKRAAGKNPKQPASYTTAHVQKYRRTIRGKLARRLEAIRKRAKDAGLLFSLTADWWNSQWLAQQGRCALTGFPMQPVGTARRDVCNYPFVVTVDRIDPAQGYIPDNCRLVCHRANFMRSNIVSDEELRVWLLAMLHGVNWRAQPFR